MQVAPLGLFATATIRSLPAEPETTRLSENEPLGACVLIVVDTTTDPLRRSVTRHGTPFRF